MRKIKNILLFTWHRNLGVICAFAAGIAGTSLMMPFPNTFPPADNLLTGANNWISPILGIATLGVALIVFWNENRQDWEASLPKRLTVNFVLKTDSGEYHLVLRCEDAFLSSEAEIRTWGQQIGKQMCNVLELTFKPDITLSTGRQLHYEGRFKKYFKTYEATFTLKEYPAPKRPDALWEKEVKNNGKTLLWCTPDFINEYPRFAVHKFDPEKDGKTGYKITRKDGSTANLINTPEK